MTWDQVFLETCAPPLATADPAAGVQIGPLIAILIASAVFCVSARVAGLALARLIGRGKAAGAGGKPGGGTASAKRGDPMVVFATRAATVWALAIMGIAATSENWSNYDTLMMVVSIWAAFICSKGLFRIGAGMRCRGSGGQSPALPQHGDLLDRPLRFAGGITTLRMWCSGGLFTGVTGSGKSSALEVLLVELLEMGLGCWLPAAKPDDGPRYARLAKRAGRPVVRIGYDAGVRVNFIEAIIALSPHHDLGTLAVRIADGIGQLTEVLGKQTTGGGGDTAFWRQNAARLVRSAVLLLLLANRRPLTLALVIEAIQTAPKHPDQIEDAGWQRGLCYQLLREAERHATGNPDRKAAYLQVGNYLLIEYANLGEKTRGSIEAQFLGGADVLTRGLIAQVLSSATPNFSVRDAVAENAVVISDFNGASDGPLGIACHVAFKVLFQQAILARAVTASTLPFALVIDEAQTQWSSCDGPYAALQRSSRGPLVLLMQGYESALAEAEGSQAEARVDVLVNNLACKWFFQPSPTTCDWLCTKLLGSAKRLMYGGGTSTGGPQSAVDFLTPGGPASANGSFNEQFTPVMVAENFLNMKDGSPASGGAIDALALLPNAGPQWVCIQRLED